VTPERCGRWCSDGAGRTRGGGGRHDNASSRSGSVGKIGLEDYGLLLVYSFNIYPSFRRCIGFPCGMGMRPTLLWWSVNPGGRSLCLSPPLAKGRRERVCVLKISFQVNT
jgi:hypothetical protein